MTSDSKNDSEAPRDEDRDEGHDAEQEQRDSEAAEEEFYKEPTPDDAGPDALDDVEQDPDADGADEFDPELLKIPRRKRRRHPLISIVVIGFSLYLMWFMRTDILFFFQSRTPTDVGQVQQALSRGELQPNTYVRLQGVPDRKRTGRLEVSFGHDNFFPLLRSSNKVFVQQHVSRRDPDRAVRFTHQGQLVLLSSLPYRENLEKYLSRAISKSHAVENAELRRGLSARASTIKDREGETVKMTPDTLLWINAAYPNEWWVQFNRHKCPDDELALKQLLGHKLLVAQDSDSSRMFWRLVVRADTRQFGELTTKFRQCRRQLEAFSPLSRKPRPQDAAAAGEVKTDAQSAAKKPGAALQCCAGGEVVPRVLAFTGRWDQLSFKGDQLLINSADETFPTRYRLQGDRLVPVVEKVTQLPASAIRAVEISSPFEVPADALVLLTDKQPNDHWYYALLYLVLFGFIALNGYILRLRFRKQQ